MVDKLSEYNIEFKGLKDGIHSFDYVLGDDFLSLFEKALYEKCDIKMHVSLEKKSDLLTFNYHFSGYIESVCDKCLEKVNVPIDEKAQTFVKFSDEPEDLTDEILVLPHEAHEVNVAKIFYDIIITSLPIRHLHPEDADGESTCDAEMINTLSDYLVQQGESEENQESNIDPRWEELKKLIDNNK
ncbi:DUF177 domain-containing protein [Marinilabiliaceae bacterium ANBcel2]|nr:DUF177 domain-containing protein [Marinilabiliaceae bacterium ANBcel2]